MQYTYCVMIQSLHLDIASDFDLFTFLSFRPWVYRLFSWAAQQQLQTRLQHRRKLLHSIWCLLSCSYRWTDPDLFIWMQKKISCTDIMSICHLFLHALGRIIMIFVCVCVCIGVMSGFNMSSDLQRPEHNIPVGTLTAVFTSYGNTPVTQTQMLCKTHKKWVLRTVKMFVWRVNNSRL